MNSRAPAGWRIRRCPKSSTRQGSGSITTSGRCRSRAWARCCQGINLVTTILKMRAPGTELHAHADVLLDLRWPRICLIVAAFPILTATFAMLLLCDRYLGFHFLHERPAGGNPMMYINLIWAWGHPEVYILILPAFRRFLRSHLDVLRASPYLAIDR